MTDADQNQIPAHESAVASPTMFSITVEPQRDRVRIAPHGELDLATVGQLERQLAELIAAGFGRITIDLRSVEFIDSTGLGALLSAHAQAQRDRWELSIIPGPPAVQHLFEITSTINRLPFTVDRRPAWPGRQDGNRLAT